MSKFHRDLKYGNQVEQQVIKFFSRKGYLATPNTGRDPKTGNQISLSAYDVKLVTKEGKYKFIEVKSDRMANRTDNVAVELSRFCGGMGWQPTGIFRSQSDFIVYKIGGIFYLAERKKLVNAISDALEKKTNLIHKVLEGGDRKATNIALIKRGDFVKLCEMSWYEKTMEEKDLRN